MSTIRHEIDHELNQMKLPSDFASTIMQTKKNASKPFYKRLSAAAVLLIAVLILGTSTAAAYILQWQASLNDQMLPDLDQIAVHPYAMGEQNIQTRYDNYEEIKKEMPFPLLDSEFSNDEEILYADYISYPYAGLQTIIVREFILGDATLLEISEDKSSCTWEGGEEFSSPVDLQIDILSDETKSAEQLLESQYIGDFKFIEQYTSRQGYKVDILSTTFNSKSHHAIFVADGIKYTLSGGVTLEKMKEIVDSMQY